MGYFVVLTQNWLASTLDYIVVQMRKANREKGYCLAVAEVLTVDGLMAHIHVIKQCATKLQLNSSKDEHGGDA